MNDEHEHQMDEPFGYKRVTDGVECSAICQVCNNVVEYVAPYHTPVKIYDKYDLQPYFDFLKSKLGEIDLLIDIQSSCWDGEVVSDIRVAFDGIDIKYYSEVYLTMNPHLDNFMTVQKGEVYFQSDQFTIRVKVNRQGGEGDG